MQQKAEQKKHPQRSRGRRPPHRHLKLHAPAAARARALLAQCIHERRGPEASRALPKPKPKIALAVQVETRQRPIQIMHRVKPLPTHASTALSAGTNVTHGLRVRARDRLRLHVALIAIDLERRRAPRPIPPRVGLGESDILSFAPWPMVVCSAGGTGNNPGTCACSGAVASASYSPAYESRRFPSNSAAAYSPPGPMPVALVSDENGENDDEPPAGSGGGSTSLSSVNCGWGVPPALAVALVYASAMLLLLLFGEDEWLRYASAALWLPLLVILMSWLLWPALGAGPIP
ncbi:hypothetical protein B0H19DRAFT_1260709 [Mycena capillaripes]|nr:hypothetical protein B0H19DRAFT_1260709 [Mycena capillaripes]